MPDADRPAPEPLRRDIETTEHLLDEWMDLANATERGFSVDEVDAVRRVCRAAERAARAGTDAAALIDEAVAFFDAQERGCREDSRRAGRSGDPAAGLNEGSILGQSAGWGNAADWLRKRRATLDAERGPARTTRRDRRAPGQIEADIRALDAEFDPGRPQWPVHRPPWLVDLLNQRRFLLATLDAERAARAGDGLRTQLRDAFFAGVDAAMTGDPIAAVKAFDAYMLAALPKEDDRG